MTSKGTMVDIKQQIRKVKLRFCRQKMCYVLTPLSCFREYGINEKILLVL